MSYVDGYLLAVASDKREDYRALAEKSWSLFQGVARSGMSNAGATTSRTARLRISSAQ
jgi:uncharacterized protein YbaA (DUF1428 family)